MHNGAVGLDGPAHDIVVVLEIDDDDLWLCIVVNLLPHADVVVALECTAVKAN